MEPLSEFAAKTHAELLRLVSEAARVRAKMPNHRPCPDTGACRHCVEYRRLHALIDDHLLQLAGEPPEPTPLRSELLASYASDAVVDRTREPNCQLCNRARFLVDDDVLTCLRCDAA